ncbi:hypothetical protein NCCP1664_27970 [Zafaria cholistanensis]|uniref:Oxidized purine nucleoside triphosphate hydrolase n=1 Tax=Zafaria cholistanensis TaxID=1682741 RepID=A0A5A7NV59_9MICC|nr:8-oxo-dGTP diphosphatase [Zafaria cholistanensis]GER24302.1 hypothetical protein NCCP1664_27970 [Zafaria cholistanensis]
MPERTSADAAESGAGPTAVVLCFVLRAGVGGPEVLLGVKKTGFGRGKTVGVGGKVEPGESAAQAAVRELAEETGLVTVPEDLERAGTVAFRFPASPESDMDCTVFLARTAKGEAAESAEIAPVWCPVADLPFARMWEDSVLWLPRLLAGERFSATVLLAPDNESVAAFGTEPLA